MRLPKAIYECVPVLCVAGGLISITYSTSVMSFASGALLACTGVVILSLRNNNRKRK